MRVEVHDGTDGTDAGVSLVEMLVAMLLAGLLATAVMFMVTQVFSVTRTADGKQERAAQARVALEDAGTLLRTASSYVAQVTDVNGNTTTTTQQAFTVLAPTEVVFLANLSNLSNGLAPDVPPIKVRLALDNSDPTDPVLVEQRWVSNGRAADGTLLFPTAASSTREVAHRVTAPNGRIFTAYTNGDLKNGVANPTSTVPVDGTGKVTAAGLLTLNGVQIDLNLTPVAGQSGGTAQFSSFVAFVNDTGSQS